MGYEWILIIRIDPGEKNRSLTIILFEIRRRGLNWGRNRVEELLGENKIGEEAEKEVGILDPVQNRDSTCSVFWWVVNPDDAMAAQTSIALFAHA